MADNKAMLDLGGSSTAWRNNGCPAPRMMQEPFTVIPPGGRVCQAPLFFFMLKSFVLKEPAPFPPCVNRLISLISGVLPHRAGAALECARWKPLPGMPEGATIDSCQRSGIHTRGPSHPMRTQPVQVMRSGWNSLSRPSRASRAKTSIANDSREGRASSG